MPVPGGISQSLSALYEEMAAGRGSPADMGRPRRRVAATAVPTAGQPGRVGHGRMAGPHGCLPCPGRSRGRGTSRRAASPAQAETMPTTAPGSVPAELDPSPPGEAASPVASGRAAFPVRAPVTAVCGQLHFGLRGSCSRQFCGHRRRGPVDSAGRGPQHRGHRRCHRLGLHRGCAGPTGRGSCAPVDNPWAQARGRARARRWSKARVWLRITPAPSAGAAGDISVAVDKWQAVPRDRFPWTRRAPVHAADIAILPPPAPTTGRGGHSRQHAS